jgi:dihydroorotate dehydrogenase
VPSPRLFGLRLTFTAANKAEAGGLSGPPLKPLALAAVREMRKRLPASIPVIGCGGISSGADALDYARAGAAAVQVYTAFGYGGAGTARRVKDELTEQLQREGTTWAQVVQDAVRKNALQGPMPGSEIAELIADATRIDAQLERLSRDM